MRVEIIEDESKYGLERRINNKLEKYKNDEIIDIKYTGSGNSPAYSTDYYSAMIIYK
ncbi:Protein of uncharacterised function (DUF2758) [[Clostridium] sordellii]|uniref:sporulation protein Cse60 n=1 Tax=Paraclostridium sordellii TaxID=1505 RepID=UPI0002E49B41|nr:sporulation protein Cse60 [Paeniclostridium sordellii]CEQ10672.1 Protein of uncharacterised function (DUF2758) [[Clostridium] sordellii] [Paeniclostridium sordellii]